jgi:ethanolamine ammonia-lyase small subunit
MNDGLITTDAWHSLRAATPARIALGRVGGSLPTSEWLAFKAAHAAARDAVYQSFDVERLAAELAQIGFKSLIVSTAATDRRAFLERPDLGRRLDGSSKLRVQELAESRVAPELAILVSDGLSALAVHRQTAPLMTALQSRLSAEGLIQSPLIIARFGRVALQDEVGQLLGAQLALMLIGERPGLGSPDSLGAYIVYKPRADNTDANRNCVSNIRPEGLTWDAAADTLAYLLNEARRRRLSGVQLKDERLLDSVQRQALPENT